jgi:hypothetical protein
MGGEPKFSRLLKGLDMRLKLRELSIDQSHRFELIITVIVVAFSL